MRKENIVLKQAVVKIIEGKFRIDISKIDYELYKNKKEIQRLAEKQRELKNTRNGLYEILRMIK